MRTADVVIVGGGATGVSTAFHLIKRGVRRKSGKEYSRTSIKMMVDAELRLREQEANQAVKEGEL